MRRRFLRNTALMLASAFALTACASGGINDGTTVATTAMESKAEGETTGESTAESSATADIHSGIDAIEAKHPAEVTNEGTPMEGQTLRMGIVSESPFPGVFNPFLYTMGIDNTIMEDTMKGAHPIGKDLKLILNSEETPIKISIDEAAKTVSYQINPKFKWSDGSNVTTADVLKTYEIVANNDFIIASKSTRYNDDMKVIVGIEEYNRGEADTISGIEVIDDANMVFHMKEIGPSMLWGGALASEFVNAKQLEGIAMDKIIESDALRKNPLSYGPYYITEIVSGEKVSFKANPHFIYGEPKVKDLVVSIVPPSQQVAAIKAGEFDIIKDVQNDTYPEVSQLDNVKILSRMELYMNYLSFKLGTWDSENNTVVVNENAKMADPALRKAMAHAIDNDTIGVEYYHGLRFRAQSPIAPIFETLHDKNITGFAYDMAKAKAYLDDAGYKDVNGDGFVENKDGSDLVINLAMMSGSEVAEPLSQYYMQQWKELGLNVQLVDGRLMDLNNFYERIQTDDPAIDAYVAAFGLASDPNLIGLIGKTASFNYARYTTPELEAALQKLGSNEALDPNKQANFYHEVEAIYMDEAFQIPLMNRVETIVINNRVKHYNFAWPKDDTVNVFSLADLELTAEAPIAAK